MLNFANVKVNEVVRDNEISFCGISYKLSDDEILKVKSIIEGMLNGTDTKVSTPKQKAEYHPVEDKPAKQDFVLYDGQPVWQEDFITVTLVKGVGYRVYLHCPVKGDKGQKIRYALKKSFKECGAEFSGDYSKKEFHWTFKSREDAQVFINRRKEWAKENKKG